MIGDGRSGNNVDDNETCQSFHLSHNFLLRSMLHLQHLELENPVLTLYDLTALAARYFFDPA